MNTWLILDVSGLCYRNFYAMGDLSYEGVKTGIVYGLFRDVLMLQEIHQTDRMIFCFDCGYTGRSEIYPGYKVKDDSGRITEEELEAKQGVRIQINRLRDKYLPDVGFCNLLWQEGYEADDVIASVCNDLPREDKGVIVSMDEDLYQLLDRDRIIMWNPRTKKPITGDSFRREYGIDNSLWSDVKALAGCVSDKVPGVLGVGEKTAIKFLTGELKPTTKAYDRIVTSNALWERNLRLVRLPFPGTKHFELVPDEIDERRWEWLLGKLGMRSLKSKRLRRV